MLFGLRAPAAAASVRVCDAKTANRLVDSRARTCVKACPPREDFDLSAGIRRASSSENRRGGHEVCPRTHHQGRVLICQGARAVEGEDRVDPVAATSVGGNTRGSGPRAGAGAHC